MSSASIKPTIKKLPPAPEPTKPVRIDIRNGQFRVAANDDSPLRDLPSKMPTEQNLKNAASARSKNIKDGRKKVLELAQQGKTDFQISVATGYKESSVKRIICGLRAEGHMILTEWERRRKK